MPGHFGPVDLMVYINGALTQSQFPTPDNGYFAPKSTLNLITNSSVTRIISPSSGIVDDLDRKLVEFISGKAQEIFAIGISIDIDLRNMMLAFMMHNITDRSLPISDAEMEKMWPGPRYQPRRRSFQDAQHRFRPQDFPMQHRFSVIRIQPRVILPIRESEQVSGGQFGIVYKVRLHEGVLELNDPIRKVR